MSDDELGIEPGGEDSIMHKAANFAEWCKRIDGMDRGRKRAYFRSTDPVIQQPCAVVLDRHRRPRQLGQPLSVKASSMA